MPASTRVMFEVVGINSDELGIETGDSETVLASVSQQLFDVHGWLLCGRHRFR